MQTKISFISVLVDYKNLLRSAVLFQEWFLTHLVEEVVTVFCIYIHDFYVIPKLIEKGEYSPSIGVLDILTKDFIQNNLSYRFVGFETDDSDEIVRRLENQIKSGAFGFSPSLNGTAPPQIWTRVHNL